MRTVVVFPPSLCLPNQVYLSLPTLAAALRRAGHPARAIDLNLEACHLFLTDARVARYLEVARRAGADLSEVEPRLRRAPAAFAVLRDPKLYWDAPRFRDAFWDVGDALTFFYQLDPVLSPFRPAFVEEMAANLKADSWTPIHDLYDEALVAAVLHDEPGLVALSMAFPEQAVETLRLARRIKRARPDVHVALGGPLLNARMDRWLADGWPLDHVDSLCVGDGCAAIVELADALDGRRGLESVRNLVWRDGRGELRRNTPQPFLESLEEVPPPDFDAIDLRRFLVPAPIFPLMTARGCYWGRCTFCSQGWRDNYRSASDETIAVLAHELATRWKARYVQVHDSTLPPHNARVLADCVRAEGVELFWSGGFKFAAHLKDPGYARALHAGGCRSAQMGVESANQDVLDRMDKGFELADVPPILRNFHDAGISTELLWFIGFPGETRDHVLRTVRFLKEHEHLFGLAAFVGDWRLHPDTIVFERPADFGVRITGAHGDAAEYELESGLTPEETRELKQLFAPTNNRTLLCTGAYFPHLVESGGRTKEFGKALDLSPQALARLTSAAAGSGGSSA